MNSKTLALVALGLAAPAMGGCVAAAVGAVGTAGYVAAQNRAPGQVADDAGIRICINDQLLKRSTTLFSNVSTEVVRGRVLMVGTVASDSDRQEAASLAQLYGLVAPNYAAVIESFQRAKQSGDTTP